MMFVRCAITPPAWRKVGGGHWVPFLSEQLSSDVVLLFFLYISSAATLEPLLNAFFYGAVGCSSFG
jgi:hypothetical protein